MGEKREFLPLTRNQGKEYAFIELKCIKSYKEAAQHNICSAIGC